MFCTCTVGMCNAIPRNYLKAKISHFDRLHCCYGNLFHEKDDHDLFTNDWAIFP